MNVIRFASVISENQDNNQETHFGVCPVYTKAMAWTFFKKVLIHHHHTRIIILFVYKLYCRILKKNHYFKFKKKSKHF